MSNYSQYENKGLTGLTNLGNTCFINSCMQILSHTYELNDLLKDGVFKKRLNNNYDSALLVEWDNLRDLMWKDNCIISPGKFIQTIQKLAQMKKNTQFTGFHQNDLPEFLLFVVDCFHTALRREVEMNIIGTPQNPIDDLALECYKTIQKMYSKDYSEIWNLFYGLHVSQIESLENGKVLSKTPEPFFMINLQIPDFLKEPTLIDCFDDYVKGESLEGDNAWYNEITMKKQNVRKTIKYWSLPKVLVIDLKRFSVSGKKNQKLVSFPIEHLDLTNYVIGYKKNSYKYELYGVANHSGGTSGGHYFAYIKTANNQWYSFNDTSVSKIDNLNQIVSPKAYCLFYRMLTS